MDIGKIQALHSSLAKLRSLTDKLLGARYNGVTSQEDLDPHQKLRRQMSEELRLIEEHLEDLVGDLPRQSEPKKEGSKPISVRAHKRVKSKKPRTLEEAGGDPSKLESVEEFIEGGLDLDNFAVTESTHKVDPESPLGKSMKEATKDPPGSVGAR